MSKKDPDLWKDEMEVSADLHQLVKCPSCKGKGKFIGIGRSGFICQMCLGEGNLCAAELPLVTIGAILSKVRRQENKTLVTKAKELGMKASDLSLIERGCWRKFFDEHLLN